MADIPSAPPVSPTFRTAAELEAGFAHVIGSPSVEGTLELIVRRPVVEQREVIGDGRLDIEAGLVGDNWLARGSTRRPDGSADPDKQVTLMNARVVDLLAAGDRSRWAEAGDQLYVDLDLSHDNLPGGTRLRVGTAVIEVTDAPHRGCAKFRARFGQDGLRFVNDERGRKHELRGRNATVIESGTIRQGDHVTKLT